MKKEILLSLLIEDNTIKSVSLVREGAPKERPANSIAFIANGVATIEWPFGTGPIEKKPVKNILGPLICREEIANFVGVTDTSIDNWIELGILPKPHQINDRAKLPKKYKRVKLFWHTTSVMPLLTEIKDFKKTHKSNWNLKFISQKTKIAEILGS